MAWPKGVERKVTKKEEAAVPKVEPAKEVVPSRLVGHPIAEVKTAYEPRPDMGGIKPPAKADEPCDNCKHVQGMHYGPTEAPEITWCNVAGCKCQAFS